MPKVVGQDTTAAKQVTHKACGARIEYYAKDVRQLRVHHDYGGGHDIIYGFHCPGCGGEVHVRRF